MIAVALLWRNDQWMRSRKATAEFSGTPGPDHTRACGARALPPAGPLRR